MPGPQPNSVGGHAPGTHRDTAAQRGLSSKPVTSPPPTPEDLEPPASITNDPVAVDHWRWVWSRLREMGTAARSDRAGIERMAILHSRWVATEGELAGSPFIEEKGRRGPIRRKNPLGEVALGLARELRALNARYCLDAVSRNTAKIPAPPKGETVDPNASRFIKRG